MPFREFKFSGGMNQKNVGDAIPDGQVQKAVGCRFDEIGSIRSAIGNATIVQFSGQVRGMFEIFRNGVQHRISKVGSLLKEDSNPINDSSFTNAEHLTGTHFQDIALMCDGGQLKVWDGASTRPAGLAAPTVAPTLVPGAVANGNLQDGDYTVSYYWVIDDDGILRVESNFAPEKLITLAGGTTTQSIVVSGFETAPANVTHIYVIRTDRNGEVFFFDQRVTADTTSVTITGNSGLLGDLPLGASDLASSGENPSDELRSTPEVNVVLPTRYGWRLSELNQAYPDGRRVAKEGSQSGEQQVVLTNLGVAVNWTDHDPPPAKLRGLIWHQEQLFGIDDDENMVRYTRVNQPEHWPLFNGFRPGRRSSEKPQAIVSFNRDVICYTDQAIYRLESLGLAFENARLVDMGSPVGLASRRGVCPITFGSGQTTGHVFVSTAGVYVFDGQNVREISHLFEKIWFGRDSADSLSSGNISQVVCTSHRDKVWISYPHDGSINNRTLHLDFEDPSAVKVSVDRSGFTSMYTDRNPARPIGGTVDGKIQRVDAGGTEEDVLWDVVTKEYALSSSNAAVDVQAIIVDLDVPIPTNVVVRGDTGRTASFQISPTDGRERYTRYLPHSFQANRVSLEFSSLGVSERKLYGCGFIFEQLGQPSEGVTLGRT